MNESWEPEDIEEPKQRRVNHLLPEPERLRIEADGLFKRAKKAEEKNKALTAERDQLRAERDAATARAEAAEATVKRLENRVDDRDITIDDLQAHLADLRGALGWINRRGGCGLDVHDRISAALTRTPAQSLALVKAEALREFAKSRDVEVVGDGDWYSGIEAERTATIGDLLETADRLEKEAANDPR